MLNTLLVIDDEFQGNRKTQDTSDEQAFFCQELS